MTYLLFSATSQVDACFGIIPKQFIRIFDVIFGGNDPKILPDPVFPGHYQLISLSVSAPRFDSLESYFFALLFFFPTLSSARLQSSHGFDPRQSQFL